MVKKSRGASAAEYSAQPNITATKEQILVVNFYGRLAFENMTLSNVSAPALLRLALYAIPTWENSLSTAADDAGQPKYCRAITATFGKFTSFFFHHAIISSSVVYFICGTSRYAVMISPPPPPPKHSPTPASLHSICTMAANDRHVCCHSATRPRTSRLGQLKRLRQLASLTRSWCLVTALRAQHVRCVVWGGVRVGAGWLMRVVCAYCLKREQCLKINSVFELTFTCSSYDITKRPRNDFQISA